MSLDFAKDMVKRAQAAQQEVDEIIEAAKESPRPTIVCLCGSTRFSEAYQKANLEETLAGKIVLTIGCDMKADAHLFEGKSEEELKQIKLDLDMLHRQKINLSDEVLILNVDGYIGDGTRREIQHAKDTGKKIRWLEDTPVPKYKLTVPDDDEFGEIICDDARQVLDTIEIHLDEKPDKLFAGVVWNFHVEVIMMSEAEREGLPDWDER